MWKVQYVRVQQTRGCDPFEGHEKNSSEGHEKDLGEKKVIAKFLIKIGYGSDSNLRASDLTRVADTSYVTYWSDVPFLAKQPRLPL